ncbi:MAG: LpxL/LpxP family Kdo(2)-lipid IV(A) lauroyl/palmitoleoyl acyltransferase [Gammaproteobacteria bacterium]|nr:LpxL/LpxP family Kdo(2)-lipid IV(A) lauroyl/palmitoleoyl acyltransferase [Gammaproteobacteria bacterium]
MTAPPFPPRLLSPRHWPTWLLLGLGWLTVRLPYPVVLAAGGLLGALFRRLSARRRRVADVNLRLCFPALDAQARARLLRDHFRALGIGVLETAMAWWLPEARLRPLIAGVEGLAYLRDTLDGGRGVILLSSHFTATELGVRLLNLLAPINPMYRRHENAVVDDVMHRSFGAYFETVLPRDDVRGMLRCLRQGRAVWYAPDQNYGRRGHVFAPFFGVPAATNPATGRFAQMGNAVVIPYYIRRLPGARGYYLTLLPPLDGFPGGDEVADAARVNAVVEAGVRPAPEQYLWVHRRFRTRPPGEPGVYDDARAP